MSFGIPVRNGPSIGLLSTAALAVQFPYDGLITPGVISPLLTFTRSQPSGSVATGALQDVWQTYAANSPRFVGPNAGLLVEGARVNTFPNPRLEGGTPGTPGTQPTSIQAWITVAGVTVEYVQNVTANGLNGVRYRISGTAGGSGTLTMVMAPTNAGYPASPGQNWTGSVFAALSAGSLANVSNVRLVTSTRAGLGTATQTITTMSTTLSSTIRRYQGTVLNASGTTTGVMHTITVAVTAGAIDFTLDLFWPQLEQGAFVSTPILPPLGAPAASTRGDDLLTAPLSSLNVGGSGACTVLWSGQFAGLDASSVQRLLVIDDGTTTNCVGFQQQSSTSLRVFRTTAGVDATAADATLASVGTPFRIGVSVVGDGRVAASVNGGAVIAVTGAPTSGLTTLRLNNDASGSTPLFGSVVRCVVLPFALPDADLQAAVAAFPSS